MLYRVGFGSVVACLFVFCLWGGLVLLRFVWLIVCRFVCVVLVCVVLFCCVVCLIACVLVWIVLLCSVLLCFVVVCLFVLI